MSNSQSPILLQEYSYGQVTLNDPYCRNAFSKEISYLKQLQPDRLLAGFLETAGKKAKAERYEGWEITEIQGHTLGHYLSALAQAYGSLKDHALLSRIQYICDELSRAQRADGFLFASDEEIFYRVENHQPAWVPWYTLHKIFEGLLLSYEQTGYETAMHVASALGDWVYARCKKWSPEVHTLVLSVEYGGMNDCLYQLYKHTQSEKHLYAAHMFDELPLFTALAEKRDVLYGLHANTTIPKIVGAMNRYLVTGEAFYLDVAASFWDIVTKHHTYITGGNSEWEHFGRPDILDAERSACNCETCNTYNMLKLTKWLYQATRDVKYMNYYESTWINTILSSQNPETGMTTYFQPMATGYFKVYNTPFDKFWCCTGTGMENFTKLHEAIYFADETAIHINRYVSSVLHLNEQRLMLEMEANLPQDEHVSIHIVAEEGFVCNLRFRVPGWTASPPELLINGQPMTACVTNGYLQASNVRNGDRIDLHLPMEVACHSLPDNSCAVAFSYGPVVLSAALGSENLECTTTGVDVTVPQRPLNVKDYLITKQDPMSWAQDIKKNLTKRKDACIFDLHQTDMDDMLVFTPHFQQYRERYGIYWTLFQQNSEALSRYREALKRKADLQQASVDIVPIGNDQYELSHRIRGEHTDTDIKDGHRFRYAEADGWFSYDLHIAEQAQALCFTYCSQDAGNACSVYIDGTLLSHELVERKDTDYYLREIDLPQAMISGNNTVTVRFQNKAPQNICHIYDEIFIKKR